MTDSLDQYPSFSFSPKSSTKRSLLIYLLALCGGILIPLIGTGLFPYFGVFTGADFLTPEFVCILGLLILGLVAYLAYFRFAVIHPFWLVLYGAVFMRTMSLISENIDKTGQHFPLRTIQFPLLILPAIFLMIKNFPKLYERYSYFKYVLLFIIFHVLYYLFFNYNFVDPSMNGTTGISISKGEMVDYLYGFTMLVLTGSMFIHAKSQQERLKLFDILNRILIIESIVESIAIIAGYPFGLFTMKIEGFRRSAGFLTHPNEYGKSEGLLLIYLIGLYYYYIKKPFKKMPWTRILLVLAIVVNFLGFLLSLSKNSFFSFGAACSLYFLLALFDPDLRKKLALPILLTVGFIALALLGYQAVSDKDIMALITERFQDTRSFQWRMQVWEYLLSNINRDTILFGHGLTACNMELYRFQYNNAIASEKQSVYVHNGLIQYLYDMGLFGLTIFSGIIASLVAGIRRFISSRYSPLFVTVIGLSLFVLICTFTDESTTELNMNIPYWFMLTMIFSIMPDYRLPDFKNHEYQ